MTVPVRYTREALTLWAAAQAKHWRNVASAIYAKGLESDGTFHAMDGSRIREQAAVAEAERFESLESMLRQAAAEVTRLTVENDKWNEGYEKLDTDLCKAYGANVSPQDAPALITQLLGDRQRLTARWEALKGKAQSARNADPFVQTNDGYAGEQTGIWMADLEAQR